MSFEEHDAKSIYLQAVEILDPKQRSAFVERACADNPQLQARVAGLLQSTGNPDSLLDNPAVDLNATCVSAADEAEISLDFLTASQTPGTLGSLGNYEILEVIGRGGMGIVLRAMDAKLNRVVAIKVLAPEFASQPHARRRFLREAQAAAAVSHDHIVTIHAVDDRDGANNKPPFIVMECIVGQSLQQKLDRVGGLGLKEILRIGTQIAAGLAAAHKQGLVHRDIKPANILLENGIERVKITDFGLARAIDDVTITQTGQIAGTPQYMSPEQAMGQSIDQRSDLFSLGSVLYAMSTGRPAFSGDSAVAVLRRVCEGTPRPIDQVSEELPNWLIAIINRLMAKKADDRYQTAREVATLLEHWLAHCQQPAAVAPPEFAEPVEAESRSPFDWVLSNIVEFVLGLTLLSMCAIYFGGGNLWAGLGGLAVGLLVVWLLHQFQSQKEQLAASPVVKELPRGALGRAWHDWWSQRDRWLTIGVQTALIIVYLVGMISFVSMSGAGGHDEEGHVTFGYRLGTPTPWFEFDVYPKPLIPFHVVFHPFTSSVLLGLVGCVAYYTFWRIEKVRDPQTSKYYSPAFMLGIWGVGALGAVALGHYQGYAALAKPKVPVESTSQDAKVVSKVVVPAKMVRLKLFDPELDQVTASRGDQAVAVQVKNGIWRFENATNTGNYYFDMPPQLENVPGDGLIVCRAKVRLDASSELTWGELEIGEFLKDTSKFDWPRTLHRYQGQTSEWTAKEVRYPAAAFKALNPPQILVRFGLHANGVLWAKDVELLHLPEAAMSDQSAAVVSSAAVAQGQQNEAARKLGINVEYINSIGMKLRLIPSGEFKMGTTAVNVNRPAAQSGWYFARWVGERRQAEQPPHEVTVSQPFYMGAHEVTVGQFAEYLKNSNAKTSADNDPAGGYAWIDGQWKHSVSASWHNPGFIQTQDHPVSNVAWEDAVAFCQWLSDKEKLEYRLPSEAEWEYACRSGANTIYSSGDDPQSLQGFANIADAALAEKTSNTPPGWAAAWNDSFAFTAPVGSFKPNAYGLFDMHGNVHEWCRDWYDANYYANSPKVDPAGPATGKQHVYRGGGWDNWAGFCRSADRYGSHSESLRTEWAGFRVVIVGKLPKGISD